MLVVTGACGFVGSQLVPQLAASEDLLVVSRDPVAARRQFPAAAVCDYEQLRHQALAGATILHLAARNNDRPGTRAEFRAANVDLLLEVAAIAKQGGAERFINLCSTHALEAGAGDEYGLSKREGAEKLRAFWPKGAINLYVPAIYGAHAFHGRLSKLNRLPAFLRPAALALLRLLKPMISVDRLCAVVSEVRAHPIDQRDPWSGEIYRADPVPDLSLTAALKRAMDLLAAVGVLVTAGLPMILIAVYIRLDSEGPAIFAQKRVGKGGRVFTCYKFRTMSVGTVDAATHQMSGAAITRAGRFLRKTKLDELPQVFNVLRNEMSLVGPRPCLPMQKELVALRVARGVLTLKPGITGIAQIRDIDMSDPPRLAAWDDRYRAFRTLLGDGIILLKTALGGGAGDRVASKPS